MFLIQQSLHEGDWRFSVSPDSNSRALAGGLLQCWHRVQLQTAWVTSVLTAQCKQLQYLGILLKLYLYLQCQGYEYLDNSIYPHITFVLWATFYFYSMCSGQKTWRFENNIWICRQVLPTKYQEEVRCRYLYISRETLCLLSRLMCCGKVSRRLLMIRGGVWCDVSSS